MLLQNISITIIIMFLISIYIYTLTYFTVFRIFDKTKPSAEVGSPIEHFLMKF